MSRWYRLPEPREPLEWELLRALARPSNSEAARALLANLCNACGHALGWWLGAWTPAPDVAACVNLHCRLGATNARAIRSGNLAEPVYFQGDADAVLAAIIDYNLERAKPQLRWLEDWPVHSIIRDLKDPDIADDDYGFVGRIPRDVMVLCLECGYAHKPGRHGEPLFLDKP